MSADRYAALPLRERKKAMTREAIVRAAQRLFEERGFDNVTVAQIADAANVSVKTLFVYFRSKDELAFADSQLTDDVVAAVRSRGPNVTPAEAVVAVLLTAARDQEDVEEALERFHRGYGSSPALETGLLRLWADLEEKLTRALAADGEPTVRDRLHAIQLAGIVRSVTSAELREAIMREPARRRLDALREWLTEAANLVQRPADG